MKPTLEICITDRENTRFDSYDFTYGSYTGTIRRERLVKAGWTYDNQPIQARPERWNIIISGIGGAYREIDYPLKAARTHEKMIQLAIAEFPELATIDRHDYHRTYHNKLEQAGV